jgi:hypothetical protein
MKPENTEPSSQSKLEDLTDDFKAYITTIYELNKLRLIDKVSAAASNITVYVTGAVLGIFTILFASAGVALWLNECLNSTFSGFFIVAGFYLLVTLCMLLGKTNGIKRSISGAIIKGALDNN